jgi:hypothetical protein
MNLKAKRLLHTAMATLGHLHSAWPLFPMHTQDAETRRRSVGAVNANLLSPGKSKSSAHIPHHSLRVPTSSAVGD